MTRDLFDEPAERDESAGQPADPPVSVGELVGRLRARLGIEFGDVRVAGEIGSLSSTLANPRRARFTGIRS